MAMKLKKGIKKVCPKKKKKKENSREAFESMFSDYCPHYGSPYVFVISHHIRWSYPLSHVCPSASQLPVTVFAHHAPSRERDLFHTMSPTVHTGLQASMADLDMV